MNLMKKQSDTKDFGESYSRRHLTGIISRLLVKNEIIPRNLKIANIILQRLIQYNHPKSCCALGYTVEV